VLPVSEEVPERLRAFAATDDGFAIAELDLAERRQGDLLGARQSGGVDFKVARFPDDTDLLTEARTLARAILDSDQTLDRREHRALRERVLARYPRGEALFRVG
jgi:ATP-dependent DNA helicase RecG